MARLAILVLPGLVALWLLAAPPGLASNDAGAHGENVALLVLPDGHAEDGRQAFLDLMCSTCHRVQGDEALPEPTSKVRGPKLRAKHGKQNRGEIATSILAPSHRIPDRWRFRHGAEVSPMGDYSEAMTVRQLIDLVAYLEALDEPG